MFRLHDINLGGGVHSELEFLYMIGSLNYYWDVGGIQVSILKDVDVANNQHIILSLFDMLFV